MLQVKLPQLRINHMHKNPPEDLISHSSEEIKEYTDVIEGMKNFSRLLTTFIYSSRRLICASIFALTCSYCILEFPITNLRVDSEFLVPDMSLLFMNLLDASRFLDFVT